jgi:hypothetical protein
LPNIIAVNAPMSAYWLQRFKTILSSSVDCKKKREELKAKRELLFDKYLKHPTDIHLALEIKLLDDQVAECNVQLQHQRHAKN